MEYLDFALNSDYDQQSILPAKLSQIPVELSNAVASIPVWFMQVNTSAEFIRQFKKTLQVDAIKLGRNEHLLYRPS